MFSASFVAGLLFSGTTSGGRENTNSKSSDAWSNKAKTANGFSFYLSVYKYENNEAYVKCEDVNEFSRLATLDSSLAWNAVRSVYFCEYNASGFSWMATLDPSLE